MGKFKKHITACGAAAGTSIYTTGEGGFQNVGGFGSCRIGQDQDI